MADKTGNLAATSFLSNPRNIMDFTLIKQAAGARNDSGVFVPGSESEISCSGSIQPLDGESRKELPEGERLLDAICLLYLTNDKDAISPLRVGTTQTDSDIISYNDIKYAVRVIHDMSAYGHVEVYATLLEDQGVNVQSDYDIDILVRLFVAAASGMSSSLVIPGNDAHASPAVPYSSVLEITETGLGIDAEVASEGAEATEWDLTHIGHREIVYSVNFYKTGAGTFIKNLLSYPATTAGQIWLAENNLSWQTAGTIRRLDAIMGSKYEERRQVDITLHYTVRREVVISRIESVGIDLTLSAETDLTETIEVE